MPNISFGYVYFSDIERLLFYGDAACMNIQRGSIGYSDEYNIFSVSQSRHDALSTGDLTLGFKYGIFDESAFRLGITLPVYTAHDEGAGGNVCSLHKWKTLGWAVPDAPDRVG